MGTTDPSEIAAIGAGSPVGGRGREILDALDRVLTSSTFGTAPRSRDLLSFVVTETVTGRGHLLNERVVVRRALGRPADVDTRTDASARVQARRTRDLLARYYAGEGRHDPLVIAIPVGQYAASFTTGPPAPTEDESGLDAHPGTAASTRPLLAVVRLRHGAAEADRRIAGGLTEALVQALTGSPDVRVVGPVTGGSRRDGVDDAHAVASRTRADLVLHGGVRSTDEAIRVTAHLASASGEALWSATYERDLRTSTAFAVEDDIAPHVASAVARVGRGGRPTAAAD